MAPSDDHQPSNPRLAEPTGETGMPGELIDSFDNMPGDQSDVRRPNKTDLERDPT